MPRHIHLHLHDSFEEAKHPRGQPSNAGEFSASPSSSAATSKPATKPDTKHELFDSASAESTGLVDRGEAFVNKEIQKLEKSGEDTEENQYYSALTHIGTVLGELKNIKLSHRQFYRFAFTAPGTKENPSAAGMLKMSPDKKSAEITNLGSIVKGSGTAVVNDLIRQAKASGVKQIKLLSTAKEFYEKLGFVSKPDHYMHKTI